MKLIKFMRYKFDIVSDNSLNYLLAMQKRLIS